jgi:bifunctional non-homologous end joining protein LigD
MLATSGSMPADPDRWAFEVKWDGVRALAFVESGTVNLVSRNGRDITGGYPELGALGSAVGCDAVLDGEIVAFDERGRPSFQVLQSRMHVRQPAEVARLSASVPVMYVAFDVLWLDGRDITDRPWRERRRVLEDLELAGPSWQVPASHVGTGEALVAATAAQGLEGVVAKRVDSTYEPGRRSRSWIKLKNQRRQELVVGGWLPGEGGRQGRIGALVVGYHDEGGRLQLAGKVGTGFTDKMLAELAAKLSPLVRDDSPFAAPSPWPGVRYVDPVLVAEVEFTEWTRDGTLRHPSFKGLRDDKDPGSVVREP